MEKKKKQKGQTMIAKILHRKLNVEGLVVLAPLVTPVAKRGKPNCSTCPRLSCNLLLQ